MKITIICDNTAIINSDVLGESGFSAYLEQDSVSILFDTGLTGLFADNAKKLGISLNPDFLVLSHGHRDHTGGLIRLITMSLHPDLICIAHPDLFLEKWKGEEEFGVPIDADSLRNYMCITSSKNPVWITDQLLYAGEIPRFHSFEPPEKGRMKIRNGIKEPDLMQDDSALIYRSTAGLVIITGCAHSGICNIISYAEEICKETRIEAIIGGLHLSTASDERIDKTIQFLMQHQVHNFYPCHCTGFEATLAFAEKLPVKYCGCGTVLSFDAAITQL